VRQSGLIDGISTQCVQVTDVMKMKENNQIKCEEKERRRKKL